jgi:hypothetical protein
MDTVKDIKSIQIQSKGWRVTVTMNNGNIYYTENSIGMGIKSVSIIKQIPNYKNLHSKVGGLMHLERLISKCNKSKTKVNKLAVATAILNAYNEYLPNAKDSDRDFPQAHNKEYWKLYDEAKKKGGHFLDGIKSLKFGKKEYSVEQMKKDKLL